MFNLIMTIRIFSSMACLFFIFLICNFCAHFYILQGIFKRLDILTSNYIFLTFKVMSGLMMTTQWCLLYDLIIDCICKFLYSPCFLFVNCISNEMFSHFKLVILFVFTCFLKTLRIHTFCRTWCNVPYQPIRFWVDSVPHICHISLFLWGCPIDYGSHNLWYLPLVMTVHYSRFIILFIYLFISTQI